MNRMERNADLAVSKKGLTFGAAPLKKTEPPSRQDTKKGKHLMARQRRLPAEQSQIGFLALFLAKARSAAWRLGGDLFISI